MMINLELEALTGKLTLKHQKEEKEWRSSLEKHQSNERLLRNELESTKR